MRLAFGFLFCALAMPFIALFLGIFGPVVGLFFIFTITLTSFAGIPIFCILYVNKWFKFWQFMFAGALIALGLWLSLALGEKNWNHLSAAIVFGFIGAMHGLLFWLIAIYRNPKLKTK